MSIDAVDLPSAFQIVDFPVKHPKAFIHQTETALQLGHAAFNPVHTGIAIYRFHIRRGLRLLRKTCRLRFRRLFKKSRGRDVRNSST